MKSLQEIFPRASKAFFDSNPATSTQPTKKNDAEPILHSQRAMNKTEREFSCILEAQRRHNEIIRWLYEGITLRWGGLRYTPDFVVFSYAPEDQVRLPGAIKFIEVKGPFIREDAMVKFKAARAHWPEFTFELHQKTTLGWRQIY